MLHWLFFADDKREWEALDPDTKIVITWRHHEMYYLNLRVSYPYVTVWNGNYPYVTFRNRKYAYVTGSNVNYPYVSVRNGDHPYVSVRNGNYPYATILVMEITRI